MKTVKQFILHLILFCSIWMIAGGLSAQTFGLDDRQYDVVIVQGYDSQNLLGAPISELRVYRYNANENQWAPIPFQIDQMDDYGEYTPNGSGLLEPIDEILFMAKDLGDQASDDNWTLPNLPPGQLRYEMTFQDPMTGNQGWAYLLHAPELSVSDIRYVQVDSENDVVNTDLFSLQHGESGLLESVQLKTTAGGDNIDFVDRQKLRLKAKADFGIFGDKTFTLKEQMDENVSFVFTSVRFQSYKSHVTYENIPVIRAHREMLLHVKVYIPASDDYEVDLPFKSVYYPAYYELMIDKYRVPDLSFGGIDAKIKEVRLSLDLNENATGMAFYNPYNTDWSHIVDGEKDSPDKTYSWPGNNWYMFHAQPDYPNTPLKSATLVNITVHDPPELGSSQELYYKDDSDASSSDTGDKRSYGDTGVLIKASNLAKDTLAYYQATYFLPQNLSAEQGETLFNQHTHALQVNVQEQRDVHLLAVQANPPNGGTITITPNQGEVSSGTTVTLTANANPGFIFLRWSTSETDTNTTLSFVMDQDTTITALFERRQGITIASQPMGALVNVDDTPYNTPVTFSWVPGEEHRICVNSVQSPTPKTNYIFQQWDTGDTYCNQFSMPNSDTLITAIFQVQYKLEVLANEFGQVRLTPGSIGNYYNEGNWVKLQALPDPMYAFLNWSGDLTGNAAVDSVQMDTPKTINAVFGNLPPVVLAPDTSFAEDDTLTFVADSLQLWIEDTPSMEKPMIQIASGTFVTAMYDTLTETYFLTNQTPNWNGLDTLIVTATDPLGASAQDTMLVHVLPVPDEPSSFALLSPETNSLFYNFPDSILFSWNAAEDVDLTDTLTYIFELDTTQNFNSDHYIQISGIEETNLLFDWPKTYGDKIYYWRVSVTDNTFVVPAESANFVMALFTDVASNTQLPKTFVMEQNYPNPFNGTTEIRYGLPKQSHIQIYVYDNLGRKVAVLFNGIQKAGYHQIQWHGQNLQNQAVASGLYFIVLNAPGKRIVNKSMYIR